jgi:hypothetical protein
VEKLAAEISKIEGLAITPEELTEILCKTPTSLASLLAAAKMDDDYEKNLLPTDFKNWNQITDLDDGAEAAQLPPFIKEALIKLIKNK